MTAKIIPFTGVTALDLNPDQVLEQAKGKLAGVVILGFSEDGTDTYFASSYADGGTVLWLLEKLKLQLLTWNHDE